MPMGFPPLAEELALHERVLAGDPLASVDVFAALMDPLCSALRGDLSSTDDEAYDSAVDAVFKYLTDPTKFDRNRGRLSTYLMDIAKKRAIDRLRSRTAAERRDDNYAKVVELRARNPKDVIETEMLVHELWPRVEAAVPSEQDRTFLKLYLEGERSTAAFAEVLGITRLPRDEIRLKVKQHQDRLLKVLKRLGARLTNDAEA
jgi:RNA polymerase sigma-70 factor (ECF subfamily)